MKKQLDQTGIVSTHKLDDRHVLITGASSGLGWALAEYYAVPGRILSITGRDPDRLAAITQICRAKGAEVWSTQLDVTDSKSAIDWVTERDTAHPVDVVIANAGMGGAATIPGPSGEQPERANMIISVNVLGTLNFVTALVPPMTARGRGRIVLIGSLAGGLGLPQSPVYSASKAAIRVYSDGLRRLLAPQGVTVTHVIPGFIDTPMSRSLPDARPFCWPADKAAARIANDVARGKARCAFPWPLHAAVGLHNMLPLVITDFVFRVIIQKSWSNADQDEPSGS